MPTIILVETNGNLKDVKLKTISDEELTKKYGLKTADAKHSWAVTIGKNVYDVALYAKTSGRAGQENKYEFLLPNGVAYMRIYMEDLMTSVQMTRMRTMMIWAMHR